MIRAVWSIRFICYLNPNKEGFCTWDLKHLG
jgi:hypothetical protein